MPLTMAQNGEIFSVKRVGGQDDARHFLAKLGFVPGSQVTVVAKNNGNVIVGIKESRIAVSREMAARIMV